MNLAKLILVAFLALLLAAGAVAQTPKRRAASRPAAPKAADRRPAPEPVATPSVIREPNAPTALAIINGQTITTADIDPRAAEELQSFEGKIADARRQILDIQINTLLLDAEARKRKLSAQQLYDAEVVRRIVDPTEAEIKGFKEENQDQIGEGDPASVRTQIIAFLRGDREAKLAEEFVSRLRGLSRIAMGADMNSPDLGPDTVVATVGGKTITMGVLQERLKPVVYKLQINAYEIEKVAVERTIDDVLLIAEANRRNVAPEDIVRTEISEKIHVPTEAEVIKFYSENKAQITGDLDSVRNQLATHLQDQDQQRLERAMSERLRKGADIRLLITEPQPPFQLISTDDDPSRGDTNAPVTIVEFTDFQCPACAAMNPILEDALKSYGTKVRFVIRDFPLPVHPNARKAAEAANAANAQGKFFEYAAVLFKQQKALDVESLKKYATELGLNRVRFDVELDNGTYNAEIRHDIDDGQLYGVESTPTIFVNGVMLRMLSAEGLRAAIDRALAPPSARPSE